MNIKELDAIAEARKPWFWSDNDLDTLDIYYGRVPVKALAAHLGRSINAIQCKAHQRRLNEKLC